MTDRVEELLGRLAAGDEVVLRPLLTLEPEVAGQGNALTGGMQLAMPTRILVRLAALLAVDAPATSLRWAVEMACAHGASDEQIVAVLLAVAPTVGTARVVAAAPRLALAIGYDVEQVGWDGS